VFPVALLDHPRRVFLLDGCGALLTCAGLLLVLLPFERHFGLPAGVLQPLAAVALVFALYSFGCWASFRHVGPGFLVGIALANAAYCVVSGALVLMHRAAVTPLGFAYFSAEAVILCLVVTLELKTAARWRASR